MTSLVIIEPETIQEGGLTTNHDAAVTPLEINARQVEITGGEHIKSAVYGGLDGIITTFAIISAGFSSGLTPWLIFILALSNVVGDGLSMAAGDFLSTRADLEFQRINRRRQVGEDRDELLSRRQDLEKAMKNASVTFISFVGCGLVPIIPFFIAILFHFHTLLRFFLASTSLTGLLLFFLGFLKSRLSGSGLRQTVLAGLETFFVGGFAAGVTFSIAYFLGSG